MRQTIAWSGRGLRLETIALLCGLLLLACAQPLRAGFAPGNDAFSILRGHEGFWRVGKTRDGVWWFVSPAGKREFLNMVTSVQPTLRGRDSNGPDFISRDYNEADPASVDRWAQATVMRITDAGFKGVGAWSHPALHRCDVPMTQDLNLSQWTRGRSSLVFSPAWPAIIEKAIESQAASLRENKNLVGYFLDNELHWDDEAVGPAAYFDDLRPDDPNRREVIGTIRSLWKTPEAFSRDWKMQIESWAALDNWRSLPKQPGAYQQLAGTWLSHLAETYFRTTCSLLRRYDPNHLILGVRFRGNAPRQVVRASRDYTDAQSLNYYVCDAKLDAELFKMLADESQQPIVISEYSFHALDGRSGDRNTIGFDAQVLDQQARADAYRLFTSGAARVPEVIGADWFQWMDEPPTGRAGDGEDVNFGVVDIDDNPYKKLVDAIRSTGPLLNGLHERSAPDLKQGVWRENFAQTSFHVPFLTRPIRVNGELSDWPADCKLPGIHSGLAVGSERDPLPKPNVYLGWADTGLYIAFEVFDYDVFAAPANGSWWARDSIEFWISTRPGPPDQNHYDPSCHHFFFVPVDSPTRLGTTGVVGQWHAPGDGLQDNLIPHPDIRCATRILPDRYVTEIFIPARALSGWDPRHHSQLAFNAHVRNYQHAAEYFWSAPKQVLTQCRPGTWGTLVLELPRGAQPDQNLIAGTAAEAK